MDTKKNFCRVTMAYECWAKDSIEECNCTYGNFNGLECTYKKKGLCTSDNAQAAVNGTHALKDTITHEDC